MINTISLKIMCSSFYYYATKEKILLSAGIEEAKLFVAALDNREHQNSLVHHVAHNHPHCKIVARALDRHHVYELQNAGAHHVVRELFESSLEAGRLGLEALGMHPFLAERKARAFRTHDIRALAALKPAWDEAGADHNYINQVRSHAEELERVMNEEAEHRHDTTKRGWTPPPAEAIRELS